MRLMLVIVSILTAVVLAGCTNTKSPAAAAASSSEALVKSTAGMNSNGVVVDSSKVEAGSGQQVKGLNDVEGEIIGKPAASSNFTKLKIGMSMQQVINAIGQPSDQGEYESGKRWIPFYYGDDVRRTEMVYKGQGRLTFASGSAFGGHEGALIRIIHNATEAGTR